MPDFSEPSPDWPLLGDQYVQQHPEAEDVRCLRAAAANELLGGSEDKSSPCAELRLMRTAGQHHGEARVCQLCSEALIQQDLHTAAGRCQLVLQAARLADCEARSLPHALLDCNVLLLASRGWAIGEAAVLTVLPSCTASAKTPFPGSAGASRADHAAAELRAHIACAQVHVTHASIMQISQALCNIERHLMPPASRHQDQACRRSCTRGCCPDTGR